MRRTVVLGAAGAALATAAAGGVAFAANSSRSTAPTSAAAPTTAVTTAASTPPSPHAKTGHRRRALAARALHGTFTVQRKTGPSVVDVQRGQVTRSDPASVTVHSTDGFEATYAVNSATHIRKDKKAATVAALTPGSKVALAADDAGGHPVARVIRVAG